MHRATIFLQDFFTIDNTRPLAIIFFHQNKRPSPIKGPLLKIRLQDPLNVLRENSSLVHYWCAYGIWINETTGKKGTLSSPFLVFIIYLFMLLRHVSKNNFFHGKDNLFYYFRIVHTYILCVHRCVT